MSDHPVIDPSHLRRAFSSFVTGVTIVCCRDQAGEPVGFTANSFTSVSLTPPLLLVSITRGGAVHQSFQNADSFSVSVLAADQQDIADRFADPHALRFAPTSEARPVWSQGPNGLPFINNALCVFFCSQHQWIEAGDHSLLIGQVEALDHSEGSSASALGYFQSRYVTIGSTKS